MNSRLVQLLLALSLLLNCFVLAGFVYRTWIAPPPPERFGFAPGPRPGTPLEMMAADLKLDENQRKALHDVFEKNQTERRERIREIQQMREQISDELKKQPVDLAKIDSLVDQVGKLRGEQQKVNLHGILEFDSQLTPEQRERMHEILADRYIGPPGRPGGPRGPGRPPR